MKKIAIITSGVSPVPATKGGAVENLVETLLKENEKKSNFEFTVFSIAESRAENLAGTYTHSKFRFIETRGRIYRISRVLRSAINRFSPVYFGNQFISSVLKAEDFSSFDAVVLENAPQFAAPLKRKFPSVRVISHLHNRYVFEGMMHQQQILAATDAFLCVSEYICRQVLTCKTVSKETVHCLHNGIDTVAFSRKLDASERNRLRASLKIAEDDFLFIFSGRTVPEKGIRELVQAFEIVRCRNSGANLKLLIMGASGFSGSAVGDVAKTADENIFFSGFIDYEKMWKFLNLGDVAVLPSIWEEPFCLALTEAMCCGLPIIATDSGGILEIATNESAVIVPRGDAFADRLADAMSSLIHDPEKRTKMSTAARERGAYFSQERYWNAFCELIHKHVS